jgi:hypothetical protein
MSDALEKAFPCGGCPTYTGDPLVHLKICPTNYRKRAVEFARLLGVV